MRAICFIIGYFFGSFLTANAVTRAKLGKPASEVGSRNPGMANVGALLGPKYAALTLAGDLVKVIISVIICDFAFPHMGALAAAWCGTGCVVGHDFPLWHRLRGGKGVACTCAAIILTNPLWGIISSLAGLATTVASKQLSVGAVCITAVFTLFIALFGSPRLELSLLAAALTVLMVGKNLPTLKRIVRGQEPAHDILKKLKH